MADYFSGELKTYTVAFLPYVRVDNTDWSIPGLSGAARARLGAGRKLNTDSARVDRRVCPWGAWRCWGVSGPGGEWAGHSPLSPASHSPSSSHSLARLKCDSHFSRCKVKLGGVFSAASPLTASPCWARRPRDELCSESRLPRKAFTQECQHCLDAGRKHSRRRGSLSPAPSTSSPRLQPSQPRRRRVCAQGPCSRLGRIRPRHSLVTLKLHGCRAHSLPSLSSQEPH